MIDARELDQRVKALTKAITKDEDQASALSLLKGLIEDSEPNEEMLRTTRAGVFVGRLRNHKNKEIASKATQLVGKWKKGIEAQKHAKAKQTKMGSPAPPATPPVSSGTPKTFSGDPEKRNTDIDSVDTDRTSSRIRNNCIKLMYNGLAYRSTEHQDVVILKAVAVEDAAYRHFNGETADYKAKIRSLFQNLKNKSNAELGRRVMGGEIPPDRFVVMSHDELKSAERKKQDEELEKQNMKNAQVPQAEKSVSTEFKCAKCGERKVSYSQAQTRSADEPMTTFCECTICGNRWKFS